MGSQLFSNFAENIVVMEEDVRWIQRFENFEKALKRLREVADYLRKIMSEETASASVNADFIRVALVHCFEFTQELSWKVMKDYAEYQGYNDITGSQDAMRRAFSIGLISDERWMKSISDRNLSSHVYDEDISNELSVKILEVYLPLFCDFHNVMLKKKGDI